MSTLQIKNSDFGILILMDQEGLIIRNIKILLRPAKSLGDGQRLRDKSFSPLQT